MTDKHIVRVFVSNDHRRHGDKKIKIHVQGIPGSIWIRYPTDIDHFSKLWISANRGWPVDSIQIETTVDYG